MPFDTSDFVLTVQVTFTILDLLDFAVLWLFRQSEVASPVVAASEQFACTPLDVPDFLKHLDLVVGNWN